MPPGAGFGPYQPPVPTAPPPTPPPVAAPDDSVPIAPIQAFFQPGAAPQASPQVAAYMAMQQQQTQAPPQPTDQGGGQPQDQQQQPAQAPQAPPTAPQQPFDWWASSAGHAPTQPTGMQDAWQAWADRSGQRFQDINKPGTVFTPPEGGGGVINPGGLFLHDNQQSGVPQNADTTQPGNVLGIKTNPDGSTDWIRNSGTGAPELSPRTRTDQPDVLQKAGRWFGAAIGSGLDLLGMGAKSAEAGIGTAQQAVTGGGTVDQPVPLPGGSSYIPPTATDGQKLSGAIGGSVGGGSGGHLVDVVKQLYGDTPESQKALNAVTQMAYSPPEAQLQAVARMVKLGQTPEVAINGDGQYVQTALYPKGYLDNPIKAILSDPSAAYAYHILQHQGMDDAQIINKFNTAGLVGAQYMPSELLGQAVLDPMLFAGEPAAKVVDGLRESEAMSWFARPATLDEAVTRLTSEMKPTGTELDGWIPWAKTPTSMAQKTVELGHNAVSLILSTADQAGKAGEAEQLTQPRTAQVLQALVDSAAPQPLRADFASDLEHGTALSAWKATTDNAAQALANNPVAQSMGGRVGAALTRKLLTDPETGEVSADALMKLLKNPDGSFKPAYEVLQPLMKKYQAAAVDLLSPERAGQTLKQWVAAGKDAADYPIFERGLAGASEKAGLARQAANLGGKIPLSVADTAALGLNDFKNWVNGGLWSIFAKYNPAYGTRHAISSLVVALADGNMTLDKTEDITAFTRDILGSPLAATRVFGRTGEFSSEAESAARAEGGLGYWVKNGASGVAHDVQQKFSQRIVYTAAKRYLDNIMVLGKGIPELPPGVVDAIGQDVARGLEQRVSSSYGDIPSGLAWLKQQVGTSDTWRTMPDDAWKAINEFHGPTARKFADLLETAGTPEEFRAGVAAIRSEARTAIGAAKDAEPALAAMSDKTAESYGRLVQDTEKTTGEVIDPKSFEAKLKADRQARDTAEGVAWDALKKNPSKDNASLMQAAKQQIDAHNAETLKAADQLRTKAWDDTAKVRALIKSGGKDEAGGGAWLGNIWKKYRKDLNALWEADKDHFTSTFQDAAQKMGTPHAAEAEVLKATETAAQASKPAVSNPEIQDLERQYQVAKDNTSRLRQEAASERAGGSTVGPKNQAFLDAQKRSRSLGMMLTNARKRGQAAADLADKVPAESLAVTQENLVNQPRHGLPADVSKAIEDHARQMLTDLGTGTPGQRIGVGTGVDSQTVVQPTTYPDFYRDLSDRFNVKKADVEGALKKIIADSGTDTGLQVTRVKEWIVKHLTEGDPINGTPPEPALLWELGKHDQAAEASQKWAEAGVSPSIRSTDVRAPAEQPPAQVPHTTTPSGVATNAQGAPLNPDGTPIDWRANMKPGSASPKLSAGGVTLDPSKLSPDLLAQNPELADALKPAQPPTPATPPTPTTVKGNAVPTKWTPADPRSILPEIDRLEAQTLAKWGQTRPLNLTDEHLQMLDEWAGAAAASAQQHRAIAGSVGGQARDFALLNYSNRNNLDSWLGVVMPYQYWYGRTYANWATRAATNPALMANYGRYRQALDTMHAGLPDYWKQQLSTDDLGMPLSTPLMFNLEQTLSPLYGLLGTDFSDPNRRRANLFGVQGAGAALEDMGSFGPSLWAPVVWAAAAGTMRDDPQSAMSWINNYLGTGFKSLRAATALTNQVVTNAGGHNPFPAGGLNVDPQMMIANAAAGGGFITNSMTQWERNRVGKIMTDLASNPQPGVDPKDWQAQVSEAAYLQRGPLWDKAIQQMFTETAPAVLASYLFGLGFKGRQDYETEFSQIYAQKAYITAQSGNWSKEQVAQAYLDLAKRFPDYQIAAFTTTPGAPRDDPWVWEAISRVGIGNSSAWTAAGLDPNVLSQFFKSKTTAGMDPMQREQLLAAANAINAVTRPVSFDEQQKQLDAHARYLAEQSKLTKQFPAEAFALEQQYSTVRDTQGPDAAKQWLDALPVGEQGNLYAMWDARTTALEGDPLVARYYVDPNRARSLYIGQWMAAQEQQTPGIGDLATAYHDLKAQDATAAAALLADHPELKTYWAARDQFYNTDLPQQVKDWAAKLPQVSQGQLRQDVTPGGALQTAIVKQANQTAASYSQAEASGQVNSAQAAKATGSGTGGTTAPQAPPSTPQQTIMDRYTSQADAARAQTLDNQTYLTPKSRLDYQNAVLEPIVKKYGSEVAARMLLSPYTDPSTGKIMQWQPQAPTWEQDLLQFVGNAKSIREALLADTTGGPGDANWVHYVSDLRAMTPEQLTALGKQYPQLADAAIVAQQAKQDPYPSWNALHDVLGMTVTIGEDGHISVGSQSVSLTAKEKAALIAGKLDPTQLTGKPAAGSGSALPPRSTLARIARGGGGGGGGRVSAAALAQQATDKDVASWMAYDGNLKLTNPSLSSLLKDYFDTVDIMGKETLLRQHPELYQLLKSLGDAKLQDLMRQYTAWRASLEPKNAKGGTLAPARARFTSVHVAQQAPQMVQ